jgi:hypothetical protein
MDVLGDVRELNKKRHVYAWTSGAKVLYIFDTVVRHGVARMEEQKNEKGIKALKDAGILPPSSQ